MCGKKSERESEMGGEIEREREREREGGRKGRERERKREREVLMPKSNFYLARRSAHTTTGKQHTHGSRPGLKSPTSPRQRDVPSQNTNVTTLLYNDTTGFPRLHDKRPTTATPGPTGRAMASTTCLFEKKLN